MAVPLLSAFILVAFLIVLPKPDRELLESGVILAYGRGACDWEGL